MAAARESPAFGRRSHEGHRGRDVHAGTRAAASVDATVASARHDERLPEAAQPREVQVLLAGQAVHGRQ